MTNNSWQTRSNAHDTQERKTCDNKVAQSRKARLEPLGQVPTQGQGKEQGGQPRVRYDLLSALKKHAATSIPATSAPAKKESPQAKLPLRDAYNLLSMLKNHPATSAPAKEESPKAKLLLQVRKLDPILKKLPSTNIPSRDTIEKSIADGDLVSAIQHVKRTTEVAKTTEGVTLDESMAAYDLLSMLKNHPATSAPTKEESPKEGVATEYLTLKRSLINVLQNAVRSLRTEDWHPAYEHAQKHCRQAIGMLGAEAQAPTRETIVLLEQAVKACADLSCISAAELPQVKRSIAELKKCATVSTASVPAPTKKTPKSKQVATAYPTLESGIINTLQNAVDSIRTTDWHPAYVHAQKLCHQAIEALRAHETPSKAVPVLERIVKVCADLSCITTKQRQQVDAYIAMLKRCTPT